VYGDFSRILDPRPKRYSAVWAQQGRLQLDADLNEQTAIVLDYLRTLAVDFIGPFGGHVHRAGFGVHLAPVPDGEKPPWSVHLSDGHYYVYGLRCQTSGPDAPTGRIELGHHESPLIVELLVWEQTVGAIQDPTLIEPALGLGAPDTALRSQVRWRVLASRELPGVEGGLGNALKRAGSESAGDDAEEAATETVGLTIIEAYAAHQQADAHRPQLQARATATSVPADEEDTAPVLSAYRGVENQLYRVEVHTGGGLKEATFKWSRDNGSVVLALDAITEEGSGGFTAVLSGLWRDARAGIVPGDWVELVDDGWAPAGEPPSLLLVEEVTLATRTVKLSAGTGDHVVDETRHPFLRRWDQRPTAIADDNAIAVAGAQSWLDLEDGVQVQFAESSRNFQRGDYWLIPARTATGGVLWPVADGAPAMRPPDGPARYRAPLALLPSTSPEDVVDLRTRFTHLAWPEFEGEQGG
jgi:hypothetical protein